MKKRICNAETILTGYLPTKNGVPYSVCLTKSLELTIELFNKTLDPRDKLSVRMVKAEFDRVGYFHTSENGGIIIAKIVVVPGKLEGRFEEIDY